MKQLLILHILFSFALFAHSQTPRGRVQIHDGTLVTDSGTLLRGAFVSIDNPWFVMPEKADVSAIKNCGLNCIHLYAENPWDESVPDPHPGYNMAKIDSLVKWTAEDSLYLILTMAGWTSEVDTFLSDFWSLYANRYKNETHLIFEICNEPLIQSIPYDSATLVMEKNAYDTIRKYAPETHIQFMSYPFTINADSAIVDIKALGEEIDWNNASIAAHGYQYSSEENRNFIKTLKDSGYAVTITEIPVIRIRDNSNDHFVNMAFTRVYEEDFVSYCHFLSLYNIVNDKLFKDKIESSEIRWVPDFGIWPTNIAGIKYIDPFQPIDAAFCDKSSMGINYGEAFKLFVIHRYNDPDTYIAFYNLNFTNSPDSIKLTFSYMEKESWVEIRADSVNGTLLCNASIPLINLDVPTDFSFALNKIEGIHKIFLIFNSNTYVACKIDRIQFSTGTTSLVNIISEKPCIRFYPNPAHDFIRFNLSEPVQVDIYSIQGQLLFSKKIVENEDQIPVSNLTSGSYVMKIQSNNRVVSEILIIE